MRVSLEKLESEVKLDHDILSLERSIVDLENGLKLRSPSPATPVEKQVKAQAASKLQPLHRCITLQHLNKTYIKQEKGQDPWAWR